LGDALDRLGQRDRARQYWKSALRLDPKNSSLQKKAGNP